MVRWELYVNFFYSWIIFSLRCHQVEFSVLHWNEYSLQSYSFWKICREKEKKALNSFSSPCSCSSEQAELSWVSKAAESIPVLLGRGSELCRCPLMWDQEVKTKVKSFEGWGCRNSENSVGQPWHSLKETKAPELIVVSQSPVGRFQSSFGLLGPALLWPALQHWKNLQVSRKMDKMALMGEWNGVGIGLEAGSSWNKRELKGMSQLSLLNNVVLKIWLIKWSNKVNLLAHKAGRAFHRHSL